MCATKGQKSGFSMVNLSLRKQKVNGEKRVIAVLPQFAIEKVDLRLICYIFSLKEFSISIIIKYTLFLTVQHNEQAARYFKKSYYLSCTFLGKFLNFSHYEGLCKYGIWRDKKDELHVKRKGNYDF